MATEFDLIRRYFARPVGHTDLGVGDDAALVTPRPGMQLAVSTDMLVAGTHFLPDADAESLGWKALAVNLSDMAAMGAEPRWALLAASLPGADEAWIEAFARGFFSCAATHGVDVIGGDTTRGPLNLCPTVFGEVPAGTALTRAGARVGDDVWVSGSPGRAALGLAALQGRCKLAEAERASCLAALHRPQPRVQLGLALRGVAHAAIDVSDGLLADLGHVLERSGLGAVIEDARLPRDALPPAEPALWRDCLLAGGDDYELCFTAPPRVRGRIEAIAEQHGPALSRIGRVVAGPPQLVVIDAEGRPMQLPRRGYEHFA